MALVVLLLAIVFNGCSGRPRGPLERAAAAGDTERLEALLHGGVPRTARLPALIAAARAGELPAVYILLRCGGERGQAAEGAALSSKTGNVPSVPGFPGR